MAVAIAIAVTKRRKLLVFREAYHGGVLVFAHGGGPAFNMRSIILLADHDDVEGTRARYPA